MKEELKNHAESKREGMPKNWSLFCGIIACILLYFVLLRMGNVAEMLGKVISVLQPMFIGLLLAYLLRPIVNFCDEKVRRVAKGKIKNEKMRFKISRSCGIAVALFVLASVFYILGNLIWPQLVRNITNITTALPDQIANLSDTLMQTMKENSDLLAIVEKVMDTIYSKLNMWLETGLWQTFNTFLGFLSGRLLWAVSSALNVFIGVIIAVYVLMEKEHFAKQGRMLIHAAFKPNQARIILDTLKESDRIFSGFIIGKLLDSLIVGVLCFISLSIMGMPYVVLVSVIVGVTNVIPFFGPYFGAIPSAFFILLANPTKGLVFLLFIFILQQIDGNIIGPKILGEYTGLSAFWVVVSILLFGGLFGVLGMLIGVPTFGVIYYMIKTFVTYRLNKTGSAYYIETDQEVNENKNEEKGGNQK